MRHGWKQKGLWLASGALFLAGIVKPQAGTANPAKDDGAINGFVKQHCTPCHTKDMATAGIVLTADTSATHRAKNLETWAKAMEAVKSGRMPPGGGKVKPSEREAFVKQVEGQIGVDCRLATPGRVTLRRLNRVEYDNTVRDLTGVDAHFGRDFPSDDVGHGFDNLGDVLSLSPLQMEKYMDAARKISEQAILVPELVKRSYRGEDMTGEGGANLAGDVWAMASVGAIQAPLKVKQRGRYRIEIQAFGQQAGPEVTKMGVSLDGRQFEVFDVPSTRDKPGTYSTEVILNPNSKQIGVRFLNDYYQPNDPDPNQRDRNFFVIKVSVEGPLDQPELPRSHRMLMPASPSDADVRLAVGRLAKRAYRRPVSTDEVSRLMKLVELAKKEGEPVERGMQLVLQALLASPNFLFRVELDNAKGPRQLTDHEVAARLSYFLWSSMPDETLLSLADQGKLRQPANLQSQLNRMLADPRAGALAENFAGQWLQLRKLEVVTPDPERFKQYTPALRDSMLGETRSYFRYILANNRPVSEFLDSDYTFADRSLSQFYGLPDVPSETPVRVKLPEGRRGGILRQASILTLTSNPTRTSPVKRGKWILENVLGTPPPPPPPDVGAIADSTKISGKTIKERMAQHRTDPTCASCHLMMDPLGLALENYGPIGNWRTDDEGFPIDSTGELADGKVIEGASGLSKYLLAQRQKFARTLTERLMVYATGRPMTRLDDCFLDEVLNGAKSGDYKFQDLLRGVITSDPFLKRGTAP